MSAGTVFTELDLDFSKFEKNQQKLLQSATSASTSIEKNFQNLGVKSDAIYEAMRKSAENSLDMIKAKSTSSGNEIARAQEAFNAKMASLNEAQFGKQASLISSLKEHWIGATIAIGVAVGAMNKAWDLAKIGAEYEEQRGILDNLSRKYSTTADTIVVEMAKASEGLVSNADLMQIALSGIAKGLKPAQLIELAGAAEILADAIGGDTATALKDIETALATGKMKGLKPYMDTTIDLSTAFKGLETKLTAAERAQASYALIIMTAKKLQAEQTKTVNDTADKMDRTKVSYENAKLAVAGWGQAVVAAGYDFFTWMEGTKDADAVMQLTDAQIKSIALGTSTLAEETRKATEAKRKNTAALKAEIDPLQKIIDELRRVAEGRKDGTEAATEAATKQKSATESITEAIRKSAAEIEGIGKTQYEKDVARIESQAQKFREAKVAEPLITQFVENEKNMISEKAKDEYYKTTEKALLATAKAEEDMRLAGEEGAKISTANITKIEDTLWDEKTKIIKAIGDAEAKMRADGEEGTRISVEKIKKWEEEKIALWRKSGDEAVAQWGRDADEGTKTSLATIDWITKRGDAFRQLYKDLKGYEDVYYEGSKALIIQQSKDFEEKLIRPGITSAEEATRIRLAIKARETEELKQLTIKDLENSNNFFDGVQAGFLKLERAMPSWGKVGTDVVTAFAKESSSAMSTYWYDEITGKNDSMEADFKATAAAQTQAAITESEKAITAIKAAEEQKNIDIQKLYDAGTISAEEMEKQRAEAHKNAAAAMQTKSEETQRTIDGINTKLNTDIDNLGLSWDGVWKGMAKSVVDNVAIMLTTWATLGVISGAKDIWSWISDTPRAKGGMWSVPGGGEDGAIPIIAHEGEMILTKELATQVRDYLTTDPTKGLSGAGMTVAGIGGIIGAYFGGKLGKSLAGDVGGAIGSVGGGYAGTYAGSAAAGALGLTEGFTGTVGGVAYHGAGMAAAPTFGASTSAATVPIIGALIAAALATKELAAPYAGHGGVVGYGATSAQHPFAAVVDPLQTLADTGLISNDSTLGKIFGVGALGKVEEYGMALLGGLFGGIGSGGGIMAGDGGLSEEYLKWKRDFERTYGMTAKTYAEQSTAQAVTLKGALDAMQAGAPTIAPITRLERGLDYVPYDNFPALLHKGERVQTAEEARGGGGEGLTIYGPIIQIDGNLIADEQTFEDFVDKIDVILNNKSHREYVTNANFNMAVRKIVRSM